MTHHEKRQEGPKPVGAVMVLVMGSRLTQRPQKDEGVNWPELAELL